MKTILLFLIAFSSIIFSWNNHWEQTNSPYGGRGAIIDMAINSKGYIFAGYGLDLGVFRSTDNGKSWEECNNGLANYLSKSIHSITINSKDCILIETKVGLYRSTDDGEQWNWVRNVPGSPNFDPLTSNSRGDFFGVGHIFGAAHHSIYRSTDNGDTWIDITNGLPLDNNFGGIAVNSKDDIIIGLSNKGIFKSTNNGDIWININNGFAGYDSTSLQIDAIGINSKDQIFVGARYNSSGERAVVLKSANNGSIWTSSKLSTLGDHVITFAFNSKDIVFLGATNGAYRSIDGGENWTELNNNGISKVYKEKYPVFGIVINLSDDIFAGNQKGVLN